MILSAIIIRLHWSDGSDVTEGGPIEQTAPNGSILPVRPGKIWTDGFTSLYLSGHEPAVITRVSVEGGEPALRLLGVRIAGPSRKQGVTQEFFSYPPRDTTVTGPTVDAVGATILPRSDTRLGLGYELLIGYAFVKDAFSTRSNIVVDYTVAGSSYEVAIPARLVLCPTTMTDLACQKRTDSVFPNG